METLSNINKEIIVHNYTKKFRLKFLILCVALSIIFLLLDILIGSKSLSLSQVFFALMNQDNSSSSIIVWDIRMPMSLMAPLVGGALAVSGSQMQTTLNNPLADPYTFGLSAAASLGAGLVITNVIYIPSIPQVYQISAMAFIFSIGTMLILSFVSSIPRISIEGVMLFGVALMFSFDALLIMVQYIASDMQLQTLTFWKMGSLARGSWLKIEVLVIIIPIILFILLKDSWKLSILKMGDNRAQSMGINVKYLRTKNLLLISILTALSVSFVGAIGFIGLIAPHITRMLIGEDQRFFIPASFLIGAISLELASIASKTILPGIILPLTVVMSLVGVPFLVFLIIKSGGKF